MAISAWQLNSVCACLSSSTTNSAFNMSWRISGIASCHSPCTRQEVMKSKVQHWPVHERKVASFIQNLKQRDEQAVVSHTFHLVHTLVI